MDVETLTAEEINGLYEGTMELKDHRIVKKDSEQVEIINSSIKMN